MSTESAKPRTRRGNRQGTVFQRKRDGRWVAEVRWVDPDSGQVRRKSVSRSTEAAARRATRELERGANANIAPGDGLITVEAYWEQWRRGPLLSADRKASTVELYSGVMRIHVLPAIGKVRLSRLTPGHVERLLAGMTRKRDSRAGRIGEPVSGQTRRIAFTVLGLMLTTAVRDGVASANVCARVDRPKVDTAEADYLTAAQLAQVLDAVEGNRLEPLVLLLTETGLRIGEALALRWSDLELDTTPARLRVTGTVRVIGGRVQRTAPKSLRGRRTLPLSADVVASLRTWRARQAADQLRAGSAWRTLDHRGTEAWVFTTESGGILDARNAARAYERALRAAGVNVPARFHLLRHSVASLMLANGLVSVRTAAEVLGHSTTQITADTYGHVQQDAKIAALSVVSEALRFRGLPSKLPSVNNEDPAADGGKGL